MERKTEKWESLRLEAQKFAAQEFVAACEEIINHIYHVNPDKLVEGIHVKADIGADLYYSQADYSSETLTSNNTHSLGHDPTMYYVGRGWGILATGNPSWPNPHDESWSEAQMITQGYELFYLFATTPGAPPSGIKIYGGEVFDEVVKNAS